MPSVFRQALLTAAVGIALSAVSLSVAVAQDAPAGQERGNTKRMTLQDLQVGATVDQMPAAIEFRNYACGSDGGPPLSKLAGWSDFKTCPADANGLHEVYFEYDNEAEYILRAMNDPRAVRFIGTTEQGFPVVTSALFSDDGVLRGVRLVTDPRPNYTADSFFDLSDLRTRESFYLLGPFVGGQAGINPAKDCTSIPLGDREAAVGDVWVKLDCERDADGKRYLLQTRYFRKAGQVARDPVTKQMTEGQFESSTRFEEYAEGYGPAALGPLAAAK